MDLQLVVVSFALFCCHSVFAESDSALRHSDTPLYGPVVYRRIRDANELSGLPTEFVYQSVRSPRALMFLAHGCNHGAIDFWDKSPSCRTCIGLPEEKAIVRACLRRGYVPIAVSSLDRHGSRCWGEDDVASVKRAVQLIRKTKGWDNLPLYALGASSGGSFLPLLANSDVPLLKGLAIQIMATQEDHFNTEFPPTLFIYMKRDEWTAQAVQQNVAALKSNGVKAASILANPIPLSPSFFSDRIDGVSSRLSHTLVQALQKAQMLDDDGYLAADPRGSDWRSVLRPVLDSAGYADSLVADESPISEELNVAWAMHEITAQFMNETFRFFETTYG